MTKTRRRCIIINTLRYIGNALRTRSADQSMYLPKRSTTAFWGLLACLAIVTLLRIDMRARSTVQGAETAPLEQPPGAVIVPLPEVAGPSTVTLESAEALPPAPEPTEILYHVTDTLRRDGSVYLTLKAHDVPELEIARVGQALVGIFDAKRESHPGDVIVMVLDSLRTVLRFEYTPVRKPELPVLIERVGDDLQGRRDRRELTHRMWAIEVVIDNPPSMEAIPPLCPGIGATHLETRKGTNCWEVYVRKD